MTEMWFVEAKDCSSHPFAMAETWVVMIVIWVVAMCDVVMWVVVKKYEVVVMWVVVKKYEAVVM